MKGAPKSPAVTVRGLTRRDWPVIERLFGERGACGGCWCMWWRLPRGGQLWRESKGEKNRADFRRLVQAGEVHGMLAFADGEPVGWCTFGPRESFPRLERVRALAGAWDEGAWSVVCFYIAPRWRGRGVAARLLKAATERAFELGARELQGYPVIPRNECMPNSFAYTGVPALFEKQGFKQMARPTAARAIYTRSPDGSRQRPRPRGKRA